VILHENLGRAAWESISLKPVADKPMFRIAPPNYVTDEIVEFVRATLTGIPIGSP